MKKLSGLILLLSLATSAFATTGGSTTGGTTDNSLDSNFSNAGDLTDAEAYQAREFQHEGRKARKIEQGCTANNINCTQGSASKVGLLGGIEDYIGKGYAMIFGGMSMMSGGLPSVTTGRNPAPSSGPEGTPSGETTEKKKTDYCMMGAMAWEVVAMMTQQNLQENIQKEVANIKDIQLKALVALKKEHEARQTTSYIQGGVYAGVAVCYIPYLIIGGYKDPMLYVKMGGATLLSTLFLVKATKHGEAAAAVEKVIKAIPPAGDCNPWTDKKCFCSEKSSQQLYAAEFQNVCVPKPKLAEVPIIPCSKSTDGKISLDPECKCKKNKSCLNSTIKAYTPNFDVPGNFMNLTNQGHDLLAEGGASMARLGAYSTNASAHVAKALAKSKIKKNPKLTPEQATIATDLEKVLPPGLAAVAATAPAGKPPGGLGVGKAASLDQLPEATKKKVAEAIKANYTSGSGENAGGNKEEPVAMPNFGMAPQENRNDAEIVTFAQKAMEGADVSNSPDTPIFDIISNRYRRSGWSKVESAEMKAQ
jgi:hypothetical protein